MKIGVFSRRMAEDKGYMHQQIRGKYIWISIQSSDNTIWPKPVQLSGYVATHFAMFDDIDKPVVGRDDMVLFRPDHAVAIVDFVEAHRYCTEMICVHCDAGISRSAGVGSALSLWLNGTEEGTIDYRRHYPNVHVKSLMLQAIRERTGSAVTEPAKVPVNVEVPDGIF